MKTAESPQHETVDINLDSLADAGTTEYEVQVDLSQSDVQKSALELAGVAFDIQSLREQRTMQNKELNIRIKTKEKRERELIAEVREAKGKFPVTVRVGFDRNAGKKVLYKASGEIVDVQPMNEEDWKKADAVSQNQLPAADAGVVDDEHAKCADCGNEFERDGMRQFGAPGGRVFICADDMAERCDNCGFIIGMRDKNQAAECPRCKKSSRAVI